MKLLQKFCKFKDIGSLYSIFSLQISQAETKAIDSDFNRLINRINLVQKRFSDMSPKIQQYHLNAIEALANKIKSFYELYPNSEQTQKLGLLFEKIQKIRTKFNLPAYDLTLHTPPMPSGLANTLGSYFHTSLIEKLKYFEYTISELSRCVHSGLPAKEFFGRVKSSVRNINGFIGDMIAQLQKQPQTAEVKEAIDYLRRMQVFVNTQRN